MDETATPPKAQKEGIVPREPLTINKRPSPDQDAHMVASGLIRRLERLRTLLNGLGELASFASPNCTESTRACTHTSEAVSTTSWFSRKYQVVMGARWWYQVVH